MKICVTYVTLCNTEMTFKGVSASRQICVMSFSEDIQSTFHIYVNIHIVGEIRWYLGLFE